MSHKVDTVVIGGGPGGYVAAIKLGKLGAKTLLIDKDKLGGECLNYGCIPSKALISAANLVHKIKKAKEIGIEAESVRVDLGKLQTWKSSLIGSLNRGIQTLSKGNGVEILAGQASFKSSHQVEVSGLSQELIEFDHAIIATGSRPIEIPGFKIDGQKVISSKEALELVQIPEKFLVVGGGVIGLEMGTLYAKLGSQVTVVEMTGQLLPGVDPELVAVVGRSLGKLGVRVLVSSKAISWRPTAEAAEVVVQTPQGQEIITANKILLSVGRKPNTEGLGLDLAGVALDAKGFIKVEKNLKTNVSHIYAIGDVAGPPFLAHKASREAIVVAEAIAGEEPDSLAEEIPAAIFTDPEIATVGLSEQETREQGREIFVGKFPFAASGRALTSREADGFVKVLADKATERILGVAIVGPGATDLISEACLAIRMKATVRDIASTIHPHPTLPESFLEASEASLGQAIHILTRKA